MPMSDIQNLFIRLRGYMFSILALFAIGWGVTPYKTIFLSLIMGAAFSFYMLWTMVRSQQKLAKALKEGKKLRSLGTFTRFAIALLAVIIALEYPELFDPIVVLLGLMTVYIVIVIDYLIQILRNK